MSGPRVAVIGGGIAGLALAERLQARGCEVVLLERSAQLGGLASWRDYGSFAWDRFYHVILPSDRHLLALLRRIGLGDELEWRRTGTGFWIDREFHPLSSGLDFLRFRPLGLWAKARLAATILYCASLEDWRRLENIRVGDWLRRLSGAATYEALWRPLLLAKLGEHHERVSAVFVWSYVKRMFSARDAATQREQLGYVRGGYRTVIQRLAERITGLGGTIRSGAAVDSVAPGSGARLEVRHDGRAETFDRVVFTGPFDALRAVADERLVRLVPGVGVEYLGVVCVVLLTDRPLTPYYVVNIADERVPFTGLIGMSNLVAPAETAGLHLTYLPKYVHASDPLLRAEDAVLRRTFLDGLRLMLPDLDARGIRAVYVNRALRVQPLQVVGYSRLVPSVTTLHPGFFVLNSAQFTGNTLNNNEVARAVDDFVANHGAQFGMPVGGDAPAGSERRMAGAG